MLSQAPLLVAFRVAHLLGFCAAILKPLLGRTAQLTLLCRQAQRRRHGMGMNRCRSRGKVVSAGCIAATLSMQ